MSSDFMGFANVYEKYRPGAAGIIADLLLQSAGMDRADHVGPGLRDRGVSKVIGPVRMLEFVDRYHAIGEALEEFARLARTLEIQRYRGENFRLCGTTAAQRAGNPIAYSALPQRNPNFIVPTDQGAMNHPKALEEVRRKLLQQLRGDKSRRGRGGAQWGARKSQRATRAAWQNRTRLQVFSPRIGFAATNQ